VRGRQLARAYASEQRPRRATLTVDMCAHEFRYICIRGACVEFTFGHSIAKAQHAAAERILIAQVETYALLWRL
jgi:hypothetical protein